MAVTQDDRTVTGLGDQPEVRVALDHGHRRGRLPAPGQDLDEPVADQLLVVGREQMGGVTVVGGGDGRGVPGQQPEVAVVAGPRPEVMVVVAGDEPECGCDGGVGRPGAEAGDELGEGGGGILGSGEGQFEEVAEHDELGRVLPRRP